MGTVVVSVAYAKMNSRARYDKSIVETESLAEQRVAADRNIRDYRPARVIVN